MAGHNWSEEEVIVALYLYRFGHEELGLTYPRIAEILGRTPEAIFMKLGNLLSVQRGHGGLRNTGKKDGEVMVAYQHLPKDELRKKVIGILFDLALAKRNEN